MGHMLNNTLQDVLIRRARMQGKNACWVPGTDHASIATEAKVVAKLKAEGIDKASLTREEFLKHAWEWKEKHGGIILQQLRKLGASCDWERTCFTMDEERSASVLKVFVDLYNKGRIYRGVRMVNWDPSAQTALSDEEVIYKESQGKLYYLRYKIEGSDKYIVVATTRPETILGDTALCVNPNDERYKDLPADARVIVPLVGRSIPVIRDEYVDLEFGTGALKVTPAHDVNDYMLGEKFGLEAIDIFNDDGTINDKVGMYVIDCAAISSPTRADDRTMSGTPANAPWLLEDYLMRVEAMYRRAQNHVCIIAFKLANDSSGNGYNLYKAYEFLKSFGDSRAVIYEGADGEWNSDL